jgi:hypothetical protein
MLQTFYQNPKKSLPIKIQKYKFNFFITVQKLFYLTFLANFSKLYLIHRFLITDQL